MKMIEMYFEASAYRLKTSLPTNKKAMNNPRTKKYLMQNSPSLMAMAILLLHNINMSIRMNRIKKLSDIL